jgi:hypothetical protein
MKFCANCNRVTPGKPPYCAFCGCTYSVRLCPRAHINPRSAQFCWQCGSRELSTPAPKVSLLARPLLPLLTFMPGLLLISALAAGAYLLAQRVAGDPNTPGYLVCIGLSLVLLLFIWMKLPNFLKRFLKWLFLISSKNGGHKRV